MTTDDMLRRKFGIRSPLGGSVPLQQAGDPMTLFQQSQPGALSPARGGQQLTDKLASDRGTGNSLMANLLGGVQGYMSMGGSFGSMGGGGMSTSGLGAGAGSFGGAEGGPGGFVGSDAGSAGVLGGGAAGASGALGGGTGPDIAGFPGMDSGGAALGVGGTGGISAPPGGISSAPPPPLTDPSAQQSAVEQAGRDLNREGKTVTDPMAFFGKRAGLSPTQIKGMKALLEATGGRGKPGQAGKNMGEIAAIAAMMM